MLWLCLYFPQLPAEALGLRDPHAAAMAQQGPRKWLVTPVKDVRAGTPLSSALSLYPRLAAHLRKPAAERERLQALAHAAYRYGSPVCTQIVEPHGEGQLPLPMLWVEIGGSLELHQGLPALLDQLRADLQELETRARWGIAPTRLGASLLARAGQHAPAKTFGELQRQLSPLPLEVLHWPQELLETLRGIGLRNLGEISALPRAEFSRRFGAHWLRELDRIRGRAPHPFQAIHLPPHFERRFEFFQEVESVEGLLFPLRRLCVELQHYLRARSAGVRTVRLGLLHAQNKSSSFEHRYTTPTRDATHLLNTLRERLQRLETIGGVRELRLFAKDFAQPPVNQGGLFEEAVPAVEWLQTLERLRARLGDEAVWMPAATGDHRPERSWCSTASPATAPPVQLPARPTWLLRQPRPIKKPLPEQLLTRAERIEQGWWEGQNVKRDYYTAALAGGRAWIFRDLETDTWKLHGWWS